MSANECEFPFVRAFVVVEAPPAVRQALNAQQSLLKKAEARVAWVSPANLHLSLLFLGDVPFDIIQTLSLALDETAASSPSFVCSVKGLGAFGSARAPRVIWAGVEPCPPLIQLQKALAGQIRGLGVEVESREYHPHVTLGRVRSSRNADSLVNALDANRDRLFGTMPVESVVLMRSRLAPAGAEYTLLHRATLPKANAAI